MRIAASAVLAAHALISLIALHAKLAAGQFVPHPAQLLSSSTAFDNHLAIDERAGVSSAGSSAPWPSMALPDPEGLHRIL